VTGVQTCALPICIPKKDFKNIFTKFYRSEEALEIDPSGSGLGLYIDKAIINLSGGKIWFKRNKGKGTTFYFTLPTAK
jgi:signal transduction histidine kinase